MNGMQSIQIKLLRKIFILKLMDEKRLCEKLNLNLLSCLISNTREGTWPYYDCSKLLKEFNSKCKIKN